MLKKIEYAAMEDIKIVPFKRDRHSELLAACGRYFRILVLINSATVGSRRIKATDEED